MYSVRLIAALQPPSSIHNQPFGEAIRPPQGTQRNKWDYDVGRLFDNSCHFVRCLIAVIFAQFEVIVFDRYTVTAIFKFTIWQCLFTVLGKGQTKPLLDKGLISWLTFMLYCSSICRLEYKKSPFQLFAAAFSWLVNQITIALNVTFQCHIYRSKL